MIAIIFEVMPKAEHKGAYLKVAAGLKAHLEKMNGFISVERFQSITNPDKLLSLSFWRDEEAVKGWRNLEIHRQAQEKGRGTMFADYRLRVASVLRDYGMNERDEAPDDSVAHHD
jgi:heme-degrading monooxygenase HmoA